MKLYDASLLIMISILVFFTVSSVVSYKYLGPDSLITKDSEKVIEGEAEAIILKETGIDIHLTEIQVPNASSQK